jgi:hypothetical protein
MSTNRRRSLVGIALVAALFVPLVGCAPAAPPVGGVPGTYTFRQNLVLGSTGLFYGPVSGTAVVCVTSATALRIEQTAGWGGGFVSVVFDGVTQSSSLFSPWVTDPVGPSCGQLRVAQGPGFFDPNGTFTITVSVTAA